MLTTLEKKAGEIARDPEQESPVRGLPSTAAIAGHPIHPMVVPYPIAFLTSALATDFAARSTGDPFWARASKLLLGAGIVSGLAAGAIGAIDYFTIRRAREKPVGKLHAYGNPLAIGLAALNLLLRKDDGDRAADDGDLALSAATTALVFVTGWAGAELSYRHMVGVAGYGDQHDHQEKRYIP